MTSLTDQLVGREALHVCFDQIFHLKTFFCRVVLRRRDVPENMSALSYGLKLISMALGASALLPGCCPGGGIITVATATGKGSCMFLRLPVDNRV